jgi:murein DD-endopeptidase MepM/ murein hydrolase activator NlpD
MPDVPPSASSSREGSPVTLIVLHADPRRSTAALAAFYDPQALHAPHYHLATDGTQTALVPEERAAEHSGLALYHSRWRNIDRISIGITLEHTPGAPYPAALHTTLYDLIADLQQRYNLAPEAIQRWEALDQAAATGRGRLIAAPVPPPPVDLVFADDVGLLGAAPDDPNEAACVPPPLPASGDLLGDSAAADDADFADRLYRFLLNESYRRRAEGFQANWAFHRVAPQRDLGTALARTSDGKTQVNFGGNAYGFQVFAGDTIFNEIPQWTAVQSLNDLLKGKIPKSGLGRQLLEASYRATGQELHDNWRFHIDAVAERLGPPLSGSYRINVAERDVNLQVFAGDTLYCFPPKFGDVFRLSATEAGPLAEALWGEAYKPAGATYDAGSAFQQQAVRHKLGTPLSNAEQADFEGQAYTLQVFARDTLFSGPDGTLQRLSALAKPAFIANFKVAAPKATSRTVQPTADEPDVNQPTVGSQSDAVSRNRPTFAMLPIAGQPRISQFYGFTKYSRQRTDIYRATQARHTGLDFAVADGTPLLSVGYGLVLCAGQGCPFGANKPGSIVVRYGAIYAVYGHARSVRVRKGQFVAPGDVLGESGTFVGPHLHFELRPVPDRVLANQDAQQNPVNPGVSVNPITYFGDTLRPYFEAQYGRLRGSVGEFCIGGLYDQPDTTFGGPLDQRPCTN